MSPAPLLETERLILRPHREADLASCYTMWSDPAVVRYIGGRPLTMEDVWARLLRYAGLWQFKGFGYWAIEEKATGHFAGDVGFADFKRSITPPLNDTPELGWVLAPSFQRKGYAAEAVTRALEWAQTNIAADRIVCLIHPENEPSIRLASKIGFRKLLTTAYKTSPTIVFERVMPAR